MIHLELNKTNKMVLVVDDMLIIDNPVYLWRFVNDQTKKEWLIELTNELSTNQRADRFTLILPNDIPDFQTGRYHYYVYESDTPGDEDFENMRTLAVGVAEVKTTFADDTIYKRQGEDIVYKGYNS